MTEVPPDYVAELYRQTAFFSAVFGGFAVAFLGALFSASPERRVATWAIGFIASAAALFVVATLGSVFVLLDALRLDIRSFDYALWPASTNRTKSIADLASFAGMYALLVGIGLSGWARSRTTGVVTASVAAIGLVLLTVVVSDAL